MIPYDTKINLHDLLGKKLYCPVDNEFTPKQKIIKAAKNLNKKA